MLTRRLYFSRSSTFFALTDLSSCVRISIQTLSNQPAQLLMGGQFKLIIHSTLSYYLSNVTEVEAATTLFVVMDEPGPSAAAIFTSTTSSLLTTTLGLPMEDVRRIAQEVAAIL